ncbi:molybdopterin converting factor subunit 1 [Psychrobacter sp. I-STPA6b]|uniref:molybdopterin converting factor subunit 1 n=1 Tax=Psychrobacter sp. I-STPA6b TaxID=2585718 RepID=UPI001D0CDA67|nr:molybdopterin converting factor subunit 1 [Psychrobacter sp. I-STPA6b]
MNTLKPITLLYFASLAEQAGCDSETLNIDPNTSLTELYTALKVKHNFKQSQSQLRIAINDNFCDWQSEIQAGDSIAFIPPVAGG